MIDLRSDTVTRPTAAMRELMFEAEVGDDVYGDDPTVNQLEALAAEMIGTDSALFVSSGTQSNLLALMSHCQRGEEYIVGQDAHTYKYEGGGAAVLGSIQPQPIDAEPDGTLDLQKVEGIIKPDDFHFARTRLLCLENTKSGKVLPMSYLAEARKFVDKHGLGLHLDGARMFNASVKLEIEPIEIARYFDSVSVCLSKGLGAPVGSILCGNSAFISRARRWRKMLGGGMRQAGILAAGGIYSLKHNISRLSEDHRNAERLSRALSGLDSFVVDPGSAETNMVFVSLSDNSAVELADFLKKRDILITPGKNMRFVTHLDISEKDIEDFIEAVKAFPGT
jgi:threonine aldolase